MQSLGYHTLYHSLFVCYLWCGASACMCNVRVMNVVLLFRIQTTDNMRMRSRDWDFKLLSLCSVSLRLSLLPQALSSPSFPLSLTLSLSISPVSLLQYLLIPPEIMGLLCLGVDGEYYPLILWLLIGIIATVHNVQTTTEMRTPFL